MRKKQEELLLPPDEMDVLQAQLAYMKRALEECQLFNSRLSSEKRYESTRLAIQSGAVGADIIATASMIFEYLQGEPNG